VCVCVYVGMFLHGFVNIFCRCDVIVFTQVHVWQLKVEECAMCRIKM
jgi:hypothetical protein